MRFLIFDCESHLIKPGLTAPRLVCISAISEPESSLSSRAPQEILLDRDEGKSFIQAALEDETCIVVGHNIFYDLGVLCAEDPAVFVPLVFKAFDAFRVRDTIVRQQLIDISNGNLKYRLDEATGEYVKTGYTLADLVKRQCNRDLPKEDTWRLKYALLDGKLISEWPEDAKKYALDDARATHDVFWAQAVVASNDGLETGGKIPTEERATRDAWALHLMSMWGIRTDAEPVAKLRAALEAEQAEAVKKLAGTGIIVQKKNGAWSKKMSVICDKVAKGFAAQLKFPPLTPKGKISTEYEVLVESKDPDLQILAEASGGAKLLNTYVPVLEHGCTHPICARFNVLVESNRTSCAKPNLQNPPRKGGVRECFLARPGYVFCSVDYDTIELRSLAQSCLDLVGHSAMAEALRRGEDLHLNLAADFMGISREEAARRLAAGDEEVAEQRQLMKPANFGFPGGMAPDSFVSYAKGYDFNIEPALARRIHEQWHKAWPEMKHYFDRVSSAVGTVGEGQVISPRSEFVRGGLSFTQLANHYFQSLTATGAKDALWHVTRECYFDPKSPLWGSRPVIFMHDEIITEMPEAGASAAAERQAKVMIDVMQRWIPDIPIKASPVLMRRWYKGAKSVRVDGKLVPSRPVKEDGKVTWAADLEAPAPTAPIVPAVDSVESRRDREFSSFHGNNPQVYEELVHWTRNFKDAGRGRIGIRMVWEAVRWNKIMQTKDLSSDYKLNDHYHSRYARLIMQRERDLDGIFELRSLHS